MKIAIIYTTFPSKDIGKNIAEILVSEKLIACVNLFEIDSFYFWEGQLQRDHEIGAILKTRVEAVSKAVKRLKELHPYSAPCIIVTYFDLMSEKYEEWLKKVVIAD